MVPNDRIHVFCLAIGWPLSPIAPTVYRGLARRTLFDVLCLLQERVTGSARIPKDKYKAVWEAYRLSETAGFGLVPLCESDEFIAELRQFVAWLGQANVSKQMRCRFELIVAVKSGVDQSSTDEMKLGRAYRDSSVIMSGAELQWLGYDLVEGSSSWSALANILDWDGPRERLNAHGLCPDKQEILTVRDLYLRSDDSDRLAPEEYTVWGVIRTPLLDNVLD